MGVLDARRVACRSAFAAGGVARPVPMRGVTWVARMANGIGAHRAQRHSCDKPMCTGVPRARHLRVPTYLYLYRPLYWVLRLGGYLCRCSNIQVPLGYTALCISSTYYLIGLFRAAGIL